MVTCLGGCAPLGGCYSPLSQPGAIVSESLRAGVNFIDTAPFYGQGKSEETLGKVPLTLIQATLGFMVLGCRLWWASRDPPTIWPRSWAATGPSGTLPTPSTSAASGWRRPWKKVWDASGCPPLTSSRSPTSPRLLSLRKAGVNRSTMWSTRTRRSSSWKRRSRPSSASSSSARPEHSASTPTTSASSSPAPLIA